jgi:hypothetical protein
MIWVSALLLILALEPGIMGVVKGIKIGEIVELELRDSVESSAQQKYTSLADLAPERDQGTFAQKADLDALSQLLERVRLNPHKPVLLAANLRRGDYISKGMLFVYVYLLQQIAPSVTVLFIAAPAGSSSTDIEQIRADSVVGAVSGELLVKVFQAHYPWFAAVMCPIEEEANNAERYAAFLQARQQFFELHNVAAGAFLWNRRVKLSEHDYEDRLTRQEVLDWFRSHLSKRQIDVTTDTFDMREVRRAIASGDEFLITVERRQVRSVVATGDLSRKIATRVLVPQRKR